MLRLTFLAILICTFILIPVWTFGQTIDLEKQPGMLDLVNLSAKVIEYQGNIALNLTGSRSQSSPAPANTAGMPRVESLAIVRDSDFTNGTIEVELAGLPSKAAGANARGFIGIAFHVEKSDPIAYDCFYLRPTNGRAQDQLRRNHSCQYMSHPDFPWDKLRSESPGVYESYVDLVPGEWTHVKIEVEDEKARLFVNEAKQPCLIVNDLKRARKGGPIALWLEQSTDAYFRNLKISKPKN